MKKSCTIPTYKIGDEFAFIRRVLGLRQSDFAKLIGVSTQTINLIENGGVVSRETAFKAYIQLQGVKRQNNENSLRDEEIYAIDKFIEKLLLYLDEFAKDISLKIGK